MAKVVDPLIDSFKRMLISKKFSLKFDRAFLQCKTLPHRPLLYWGTFSPTFHHLIYQHLQIHIQHSNNSPGPLHISLIINMKKSLHTQQRIYQTSEVWSQVTFLGLRQSKSSIKQNTAFYLSPVKMTNFSNGRSYQLRLININNTSYLPKGHNRTFSCCLVKVLFCSYCLYCPKTICEVTEASLSFIQWN